MWIDAFFFRAAAMSPPGKKLVLHLEHDHTDTIWGYIDYTAILIREEHAGKLS